MSFILKMVSLATMRECGASMNAQMHVHASTDEWVVISEWRIDDVVHCPLLDRLLPGRLGTYILPSDATFHLRAPFNEQGSRSTRAVSTTKEGSVWSRKGKASMSDDDSSSVLYGSTLLIHNETRVEVRPTCKSDLLEALARERELRREEGRARSGSGVDEERREEYESGGRRGRKEKERGIVGKEGGVGGEKDGGVGEKDGGVKEKSKKNSKRGVDTVLQYEPSVHHLTVPTASELEEEEGGGVVEEDEGEDGGGEEDEEEEEEDEIGEVGGETEVCEGTRSKDKKSKGGGGGGGAGKRIDDEYTDEEGGFEDDGVE